MWRSVKTSRRALSLFAARSMRIVTLTHIRRQQTRRNTITA
nr:MAG TPA: hypothetical protein [Caudoviricetes sp.]